MLEKLKEFLKNQADEPSEGADEILEKLREVKANFVRHVHRAYSNRHRALSSPIGEGKSFEDRLSEEETLTNKLDQTPLPECLEYFFDGNYRIEIFKSFLSLNYNPPENDPAGLMSHLQSLYLYYEFASREVESISPIVSMLIDFAMVKVVSLAMLTGENTYSAGIKQDWNIKSKVGSGKRSEEKKQKPIFEAIDELKEGGYKFIGTDNAIVIKIQETVQALIDKRIERGEEKKGTKAPCSNTIIKHLGGKGLPEVRKT